MSGFKDILDKVPCPTEMWLQEVYVDPTTGIAIMKLTNGILVPPKFSSTAQIQTNQGPMTLQFPIEATTLEEARTKWQEAVKKAITDLDDQMREQQRRVIVASPNNMPRSH